MSDMWEFEDDEDFEERTQPLRRRRRQAASSEPRGNLYLLTGLLIGLGIGLLVALVISPVKYIDTDPGTLGKAAKDEYREIIALAYSANGNLERARERINLIDNGQSIPLLAAQAQRVLAEDQSPEEARALALLAADLGSPPGQRPTQPAVVSGAENPVDTPAVPTEATGAESAAPLTTLEISAAVQTPTQPIPTRTPTATLTPVPTFTPRPTATPLRVLDAPFVLQEKREVCDGTVEEGLLQIFVSDTEGTPLPGVRITVNWDGGQETFYTGLHPEISPGYADFLMEPNIAYTVTVGDLSDELQQSNNRPGCAWQAEYSQAQ